MLKVNIHKQFKSKQMHFEFVSDARRMVIFGPSGSGKSTLLKMIAGFFHPDAGSILLDDLTLFNSNSKQVIPSHLRNIGYLPQEYTLFPNMTVRQNILYGVNVKKQAVEPTLFDEVIDRFGIADCLDRMPNTLSGGQQQRAALARILLMKPCLLLLDEPFSALDVPIRENLRDLVMDITDEMNIPAVFVTHDIEEAYIFAQDLIVMNHGRIIESGSRNDLYHCPSHAEVARLLDFKNIWDISTVEGGLLILRNGIKLLSGDIKESTSGVVCIRPENIMILREDVPVKTVLKENVLSCTIQQIHERGKYIKLDVVSVEGLSVVIHMPEHAFHKMQLAVDLQISISLKKESIVHSLYHEGGFNA